MGDKKTKDDLKTYSTAFNPNTDILTDQSILNLSHCNSELIRTSASKSSVNFWKASVRHSGPLNINRHLCETHFPLLTSKQKRCHKQCRNHGTVLKLKYMCHPDS